jgi:hypothetical protein
MTCRCATNNRSGRSTYSGTLSNWRFTRAKNERTQRSEQNNRKNSSIHKLPVMN